jgi:CHAT domain-containing protein
VLRIGDGFPALGSGLSRRFQSEALSVARWREDGRGAGPLRVLLVVDPTGDLPGAAAEGGVLHERLRAAAAGVDVLQGRDATRARVLAALAAGGYDVLHFAGHAWFDTTQPGAGGLVCAGQEILRGSDLEPVTALPALVFCNACEAARVRRQSSTARRSASRRVRSFARGDTGIAEAFLAGGVANFLGTHWPVGDQPALAFSQTLYAELLRGEALGEAVLEARRRTAALPSLDWADYVHYGNPEFRLVTR